MPIITKSSPIAKDAPITFTLDKAALAALPVVMADAWFADDANWKKVILNYGSTLGNEMIVVSFDATLATPTSSFLAISPSRDVFDIISIMIQDFNRGTLRVQTSLLNQAEFVVDFSLVEPPAGIVWDITGPYTIQPNGGLTTTNTATYFSQYAPSNIKSGDFDITFTFASAPSHDAAAGMATDSNTLYGFIGQYGNANLHYNNVGSQGFIAWVSGENIFRMTRVGTAITMYLNGVVVGTTTYSGNLRPLISMHPQDVLTSAIIDINPAANLLYVKDFGAANYAADLSFNLGTGWVLDGNTAFIGNVGGSGGNNEMNFTNAAMLSSLVQGQSYKLRVYPASTTGNGYLGGSFKGGWIDQNQMQFTAPLPAYFEQIIVVGAGESLILRADNINMSSYAISKIEIFAV